MYYEREKMRGRLGGESESDRLKNSQINIHIDINMLCTEREMERVGRERVNRERNKDW